MDKSFVMTSLCSRPLLSQWKSVEETRRLAVEEALSELLSRDAIYRRELSDHLNRKVENANLKRTSRIEQYKEVIF